MFVARVSVAAWVSGLHHGFRLFCTVLFVTVVVVSVSCEVFSVGRRSFDEYSTNSVLVLLIFLLLMRFL